MIHVAHYLLEIAQSHFWKPKDWQAWADNLIMKSSNPDFWLIQVSTAKNIDELWVALGEKYSDERFQYGAAIGLSEAIIGYFYLELESDRISLQEFLRLAGEEADAGETEVSCELFYSILNEVETLLDKGFTIAQVKEEILAKVKNSIQGYIRQAEAHLAALAEFIGK